MRYLLIITFMLTSTMGASFAASDCKVAFDKFTFYDQSGVVDWKEGAALEKSYPELTTLTPEIPEMARFEIFHRGRCQIKTKVHVSVYGLKGSYASGEDPHHEAHGKAPEGSEWSKSPLWEKEANFDLGRDDRVLSFGDIPIEKILLSVPDGQWYWSLRFNVKIKEAGSDKVLWEKNHELTSPLVH